MMVASSVNLIAAQRLLRKNCSECVAPITYPEKALLDLQVPPDKISSFQPMKGKGCQRCNGTGYKGRIAAYEIMIFNDQLGEFVLNGASTLEIKREAIRLGVESGNVHYNLALVLLDLGDKPGAVEHAKKAYEAGFQLQGLKKRLQKMGLWTE